MEINRKPAATVLTEVVERLSLASTLTAITQTVAEAARHLSGADGATFVLKDGDLCHYADEFAISPLWKGKRFPMEACISGWSMIHRQVVVIRDIYQDNRIPHDAYRPTFVKSLCMVPIRQESPLGAIGNYWAREYLPTAEEIKLLQILANSCAVALENLELRRAAETNHARELEVAMHSLAHDLRSPLFTMMGCADVLQMQLDSRLDVSQVDLFNSIQKTGRQATEQIEKMLMLFKVTNRRLEMAPLNLTEMGQEICEDLRRQEPKRRVEFAIESGLRAFGDPHLVRVALENLLSNAFKYTRKQLTPAIELGRVQDKMVKPTFFVRDNGAGFDPQQAVKLFRPLARLHSDQEFSGTGLGLASVARIIELHGGKVRAEGQKALGATFYFELPQVG
ncbi:MAG: ATP-binding protein [Bacteriovoracia bacterium]